MISRFWKLAMLLLVLSMVLFGIFSGGSFCPDSKELFYKSLNDKIITIKVQELAYKGINSYYYFDFEKKITLIKNSKSYNEDMPDLKIGDSVVKELKTFRFKVYRNDVLIFDRGDVGCLECGYCK